MDKALNRARNATEFRAIRFLIYFFGILGLLTLGYWVSFFYRAHAYQERALRTFVVCVSGCRTGSSRFI